MSARSQVSSWVLNRYRPSRNSTLNEVHPCLLTWLQTWYKPLKFFKKITFWIFVLALLERVLKSQCFLTSTSAIHRTSTHRQPTLNEQTMLNSCYLFVANTGIHYLPPTSLFKFLVHVFFPQPTSPRPIIISNHTDTQQLSHPPADLSGSRLSVTAAVHHIGQAKPVTQSYPTAVSSLTCLICILGAS